MSKGPPQLVGSINPIVDSIVGRFSTVLATKFYGHTENLHDKCLRSAVIAASELCDQMHNPTGTGGRSTTSSRTASDVCGRGGLPQRVRRRRHHHTIKDPNSLSQRATEVIRELEAGARKQGQRNDLRPGKGRGNGRGKGRANGRGSGGNRVSAQAARGGGRGSGVDGDSASDDDDSASDDDDSASDDGDSASDDDDSFTSPPR
jgi:hypothetical protein